MPDLQKQSKDGLVYYTSPQLSSFPELRHAFFTYEGGVSTGEDCRGLNFRSNVDDPENVKKNFAIACSLLGCEPHDVVHTTQEHTGIIAEVTEGGFRPALSGEPCDAIITNKRGLCLTGFYADCQLILLYDRKTSAYGVVHAGWRGVKNRIAFHTVERMCERFGTRPRDISAAVSPSICRRCFETDEDVYREIIAEYGGNIGEYIYFEGGKWHIDLKSITYSLLISAGIQPLNIDVSNLCTKCDEQNLFWSHRKTGEKRGVHAGMIYLK